jgi:hypothetical protein
VAVAATRRRADGDENDLGVGDSRRDGDRELEPPVAGVLGDEISPRPRAAILSASWSTQVTSWPKSANEAPDTSPT